MISIETVQDCLLSEESFSKYWFIKKIKDMNEFDFDRLCREIMHLNEHYVSTVGAYATDKPELTYGQDESFWKIREKDFDSPVNFRKQK